MITGATVFECHTMMSLPEQIGGPIGILEASSQNCTKEDLIKIVQLVDDAYWAMQMPFFTDSDLSRKRTDLDEIKEILDNPNKKLFLLRNKVAILGVMKLEIDPQSNFAMFGLFAIDKKYHGQQLGSVLIDHAEQYAKGVGKTVMKIEVFVFATKLADYYKKQGYVPTGEMKTFFHDSCILPWYQDPEKRYLLELSKKL